jgi:hypothetical protein
MEGVFATDLYAPFRELLKLLDGQTVNDMPALMRCRMLAHGFAPDRLVLSIPMSEIFECFDEEARLPNRSQAPLRSILPTLKKIEAYCDDEIARLSGRQPSTP